MYFARERLGMNFHKLLKKNTGGFSENAEAESPVIQTPRNYISRSRDQKLGSS